MHKISQYSFLSLLLMFVVACNQGESEDPKEADRYISEVKKEFAPDKRVALFDVESHRKGDTYILKGESNLPEAVAALKARMGEAQLDYRDSISLLPSEDLKDKNMALINISVANIRSNPSHSAELATQATLGTPVKVYKQEGDWYYVQTPDNYLSWVDKGGIERFTEEEIAQWRAAEKVIFLQPFGSAHEEASPEAAIVSDVVAGNIFVVKGEKNDFYEVQYPDGRTAYIPKSQAKPYREWVNSLEQSGENLVATSRSLMGLPYLWGGTSPKGVDCSGFTKTIFFMNGMVIPRDASQQVHTGSVVDSTQSFENLVPGDLLFFGTPATDTTSERVVHVGMWIGDDRFIHSSGKVHISTVDTTDPDFDEFNYNRYLRTKRILGQEDQNVVQLARSDLFMDPVKPGDEGWK